MEDVTQEIKEEEDTKTIPPRWDVVEEAVKEIKYYLNKNKVTYAERFIILDMASKDISREWNMNVMANWFLLYAQDYYENQRNINIDQRPSHYQ